MDSAGLVREPAGGVGRVKKRPPVEAGGPCCSPKALAQRPRGEPRLGAGLDGLGLPVAGLAGARFAGAGLPAPGLPVAAAPIGVFLFIVKPQIGLGHRFCGAGIS